MINAGILTSSGINFLKRDIKPFEHASTAITASPIEKPFIALLVTPRVGQSPNIKTNTGFSLNIPAVSTPNFFIIYSPHFDKYLMPL